MPRPRKNPLPMDPAPVEEAPPPAAPEGADTPVRRRRRRRTTTLLPEQGNETATLIEAVLRSRGSRGASPDMLTGVITWARAVRTEGDALKELSGRPRRQKTQAPMERIAKYEMNRALLDGILAGTVALDVQEDGSLQFFHGAALSAPGTPPAPAEAEAAEEVNEGTPT